jgi:CubicO group peptidase (beta-lactamase class C family)
MKIAFNWHTEPPMDLVAYANDPRVKALGPASAGGIGSARGVAGMFAAAISELDGRARLLTPETAAEFAKPHTAGADLVCAGEFDHFLLGFEAQPLVGPGAFGHSGAAGGQGFADPATGIAYGYTRRRFFFPGGIAQENEGLIGAVMKVAREQ